ncbi:DUF4886 domain-containing protein [Parabacteroides sp. Marseille-P3160]|uniref:DUF4886 domain-containing protein n=1 Tax=Parabacteroides sp. Marseille-P3160 TaxID=1917887 RepID=UPI0009BAE5AA|nr:DUF4886 domain-containing protein [Parabacteroides sp. Marseille-P3160]
MKNILFKVALLAFVLIFLPNRTACQEKAVSALSVTNLRNNSLPHHPSSLKILGIGNSFTEDGMQYLPDLLESAGIDNVTLGKLTIGGCSLEKHYQQYLTGDSAYRYQKSYPGKNVWEEADNKCTFTEAVSDEPWDIIIIQQVSGNSGKYETYQPYLKYLIDAMIVHCPNAGVCLGWQMTWAYGTDSKHQDFAKYGSNQDTMYHAILRAVKSMIAETGIDLIIPSGTAIQNLRNTSLNNAPLDLTRDGYHSDLGAGRYTLACTWFQTLIAPCLGKTIAGNTFRTGNGNVPVTDANFRLCQKAAQYACSTRFEVIPVEEKQ